MALFSRRPKKHEPVASVPDADAPATDAAPHPAEADAAPEGAIPDVPISVTTYGTPAGMPRVPASAPPTEPGRAPLAPAAPLAGRNRPAASTRPRRSVPGIEDNVLLAAALAALDPQPSPQQTFEVARQLLQGRVYLRVRGEARELLAAGKDIPMATATIGGAQHVLAFSGGAALQAAVRADGDTGTSAVAIGVVALLRQVIDGPFAGLGIDLGSSPAAIVLTRALIEKTLEDLDESLAVKSALTGERTAESITALVAALRTAPMWIAARRQDDGAVGIAQTRMSDGTRMLEVFSHPLELHVLGRGDRSVRITAAQLIAAVNGEPALAGVVVNPQGPWMRLSREDLAPLQDET